MKWRFGYNFMENLLAKIEDNGVAYAAQFKCHNNSLSEETNGVPAAIIEDFGVVDNGGCFVEGGPGGAIAVLEIHCIPVAETGADGGVGADAGEVVLRV
jgi:hypothetical protein